MKSSSASVPSASTSPRNIPVTSTLAPTPGGLGAGHVQAGNYMRGGGLQATTMHGALDNTAQVMLNWGSRLTALYAQPYGPRLAQAQAALTAMHKDPAVPQKIRDDAFLELTILVDETDMPFFEEFVHKVRNDASAFAASASPGQQFSANQGPITTMPLTATTQGVQSTAPHVPPLTSAQALTHWAGQLSALAGQPGDAALNLFAEALFSMGGDMALPVNVRDAALEVFLETPAHTRAPAFRNFAQQLQANAPTQVGMQAVRNFGGAPLQSATASAQPYTRTAPDVGTPIGPMHQGPLSYDDAIRLDPRERPALNKLSNQMNKMVQHVLQHPDDSSATHAQHAASANLPGQGSSRTSVRRAREEIAYGTHPDVRNEMYNLAAEYLEGNRNTAFARAASTKMRAVSMNPRIYSILPKALEPLMVNGRLPKTTSWSNIDPHVPNEDDRRLLMALFKDDGYATAGVVSPLAPHPADFARYSTAAQTAGPAQDLPDAKRQRTHNGLVQGPPQITLQPAPVVEIVQVPLVTNPPGGSAMQNLAVQQVQPITPRQQSDIVTALPVTLAIPVTPTAVSTEPKPTTPS